MSETWHAKIAKFMEIPSSFLSAGIAASRDHLLKMTPTITRRMPQKIAVVPLCKFTLEPFGY
jgi:hypothetical protein